MHLTARPSGWRFQIRIPRTCHLLIAAIQRKLATAYRTVQRTSQLRFADIGHPLHVRKQVDGK